MGKDILIIADIEGSSHCINRKSAKFIGRGWPAACHGMSLDVAALVTALTRAGAQNICIRDFHRTGYNIFPTQIPPSATLTQGYRTGPVPGLGHPGRFDALMMVGMHAPSGTIGFLSHTLTSRIAAIRINGQLVSEAQLFSSALAAYKIPPLFFSGCPVACAHVRGTMPGVLSFPIDKSAPDFQPQIWREEMAQAAVRALASPLPAPYNPRGPFSVRVTLTGGKKAATTLARTWGYPRKDADIILDVNDYAHLFTMLSRMMYLTPLTFRLLPVILPFYRLMGRTGLAWAKSKAPVRFTDRG